MVEWYLNGWCLNVVFLATDCTGVKHPKSVAKMAFK